MISLILLEIYRMEKLVFAKFFTVAFLFIELRLFVCFLNMDFSQSASYTFTSYLNSFLNLFEIFILRIIERKCLNLLQKGGIRGNPS